MGKRKARLAPLLLAVSCLALAASPARAVVFGFECITFNSATDCATGEAQLSVDVTGTGDGRVLFTFFNAGPGASAITDVYFDDGTLLALAGLIDEDDDALGSYGDPNVDFSPGASPGDLPGGQTIGFQVTQGFLADSDSPVSQNGVGPTQSLGVVFSLQGGGTLADVLSELDAGTLRIGIHVQAFSGGGSESFVNTVPEPGAAALVIASLAAVAARRSRSLRRR